MTDLTFALWTYAVTGAVLAAVHGYWRAHRRAMIRHDRESAAEGARWLRVVADARGRRLATLLARQHRRARPYRWPAGSDHSTPLQGRRAWRASR